MDHSSDAALYQGTILLLYNHHAFEARIRIRATSSAGEHVNRQAEFTSRSGEGGIYVILVL